MAVKKAKLAHEKKKGGGGDGLGVRFTFERVVELVEFSSGEFAAVVDLDGQGTLGIVDRRFVTKDAQSGDLVPAPVACPAFYDANARALAIERHRAHAG